MDRRGLRNKREVKKMRAESNSCKDPPLELHGLPSPLVFASYSLTSVTCTTANYHVQAPTRKTPPSGCQCHVSDGINNIHGSDTTRVGTHSCIVDATLQLSYSVQNSCTWRGLPLAVCEAGRDHGSGTLPLVVILPDGHRLSSRCFGIANWWHQILRS